MKKNFAKIFPIFFIILFLGSFAVIPSVSAKICNPSCPDSDKDGNPDRVPDFNCINQRFIDPGVNCCEDKCAGDAIEEVEPVFENLEVFGASFRVREDRKIIALINLGVTTFLGFASLYALGRGVYLAAIKRPDATDDDLSKINKELTNMLIGFAISWGFIIIMQVVASFLGLGSINELILFGSGAGSSTITIT